LLGPLDLRLQALPLLLQRLILLQLVEGILIAPERARLATTAGAGAVRTPTAGGRAGNVRHARQHAHEERRHLVIHVDAAQQFLAAANVRTLGEVAEPLFVAGRRRETRALVVLRRDDVADAAQDGPGTGHPHLPVVRAAAATHVR